MKEARRLLEWSLCGGLLFGVSTEAAAIVLPDNGSSCSGSNCLTITATGIGGVAISANANAGSGTAISGTATGSGHAITGATDNGFAV